MKRSTPPYSPLPPCTVISTSPTVMSLRTAICMCHKKTRPRRGPSAKNCGVTVGEDLRGAHGGGEGEEGLDELFIKHTPIAQHKVLLDDNSHLWWRSLSGSPTSF